MTYERKLQRYWKDTILLEMIGGIMLETFFLFSPKNWKRNGRKDTKKVRLKICLQMRHGLLANKHTGRELGMGRIDNRSFAMKPERASP